MLGTGLGVGNAPVAPGTFGSLWGLPLVWGLKQLPPTGYWAVAAMIVPVGVWACGRACRVMQKHDPGAVVIDEIAAFPIVFAAVDFTPWSAVLGFIWFRLFDISKLWPVKRLEELPGGWGVMADDLGAGVYAGAALWLTVYLTGLG